VRTDQSLAFSHVTTSRVRQDRKWRPIGSDLTWRAPEAAEAQPRDPGQTAKARGLIGSGEGCQRVSNGNFGVVERARFLYYLLQMSPE
jgi:hypothetical protein